jgi:hypothetical protein
MCTAGESQLKAHHESKHPAKSFAECFPTFTAGAGAGAGAGAAKK